MTIQYNNFHACKNMLAHNSVNCKGQIKIAKTRNWKMFICLLSLVAIKLVTEETPRKQGSGWGKSDH